MLLKLFMNELSIPVHECALDVARDRLRSLVSAFRASLRLTTDMVFISEAGLNAIPFGANWPMAALRNAPGCKEESLFLRRVQDRWPRQSAIVALGEEADDSLEYRLCPDADVKAGQSAFGLGLTHRSGGLAVSLISDDYWRNRNIELERLSLGADAEIETCRVTAMNACDSDSVEHHAEQLLQSLRPEVHDGNELWQRRAELLPYLKFIPRTRQQIEQFQNGTPLFYSALDRLSRLNQAISEWRTTGSARPRFPFNVTPESDSRMHLVRFRDENGDWRTFSDHASITPGANRLHFILVEPERLALIGHIGRKLGIG